MAGETTQWHLRERKPENPVVFFGEYTSLKMEDMQTAGHACAWLAKVSEFAMYGLQMSQ